MKLSILKIAFVFTLFPSSNAAFGADATVEAITPLLSSTNSQAAFLIYTLLKLTKKTTTINDDTYYDLLRTTEQGALHYGISSAIIDSVSGTPASTSLSASTLDGMGFITTSWLVRMAYDAFFDTKAGMALEEQMEQSQLFSVNTAELRKEAVIGFLSAVLYAHLKKLLPLLLPA